MCFGIKYSMILIEAPWQVRMVERREATTSDIMNIVVNESVAEGPQATNDLALHVSLVTNQRTGRTLPLSKIL